MTKTITITELECYANINGLENVVKNVRWTMDVQETINGNTENMTIGGSTQVPAAEAEAFTPYDELTVEQVTAWVNENTDTDAIANHLVMRRTYELNIIPTTTPALPF
jgi:hypothetical protein